MEQNEIKRDNRKALPKYLLILLVAAIFGGVLGFAAGAMLFVSVRELIPEACCADDCYLGTLSVLLGFTVMMILDIALG